MSSDLLEDRSSKGKKKKKSRQEVTGEVSKRGQSQPPRVEEMAILKSRAHVGLRGSDNSGAQKEEDGHYRYSHGGALNNISGSKRRENKNFPSTRFFALVVTLQQSPRKSRTNI